MMFSMVLVLISVVFAVQLLLCFSAKRTWVKLIPTILIGLGELACGVVYAVSMYLDSLGEGVYGAAFAAVIYTVVLLIVQAGDALAWLIFAIVRNVQKRRK